MSLWRCLETNFVVDRVLKLSKMPRSSAAWRGVQRKRACVSPESCVLDVIFFCVSLLFIHEFLPVLSTGIVCMRALKEEVGSAGHRRTRKLHEMLFFRCCFVAVFNVSSGEWIRFKSRPVFVPAHKTVGFMVHDLLRTVESMGEVTAVPAAGGLRTPYFNATSRVIYSLARNVQAEFVRE